jgi:hypothetical protein
LKKSQKSKFEDAPNAFLRQDHYLIPFQRFAVVAVLVQACVQNADELFVAVDK